MASNQKRFSFNSVTSVVLPGAQNSRVLGANQYRRCVIICNKNALQILLYTGPSNTFDDYWYVTLGNNSAVLTYRDFGPLITGEVWISGSSSGIAARVTEIFQLP
jgi:hypothetical protein